MRKVFGRKWFVVALFLTHHQCFSISCVPFLSEERGRGERVVCRSVLPHMYRAPKSSKHTHGPRTGPNNASGSQLPHTTYRTRNAAVGLTIHTLASPRTLARPGALVPTHGAYTARSATHPRARPGALRLEGEEALWQGVGLAWGGAVEGSGLASKKLAALHHAVAGHPDVGHPTVQL